MVCAYLSACYPVLREWATLASARWDQETPGYCQLRHLSRFFRLVVTQDGLIFLLQPPRWPVIAVPGGSLSALVAQLLETGLAVQLVSRNPYLGRKVIDA